MSFAQKKLNDEPSVISIAKKTKRTVSTETYLAEITVPKISNSLFWIFFLTQP